MKNTNLLWVSASLCVALQIVHAEERVFNFSIPAQATASALDKLAAQSDLQMLFSRESLKNSTSNGVTGQFSARVALQKLLAGTGLSYTFTSDNAVAIKGTELQIQSSTLPIVNVTGKMVSDEADPNNKDYHALNSSTASKTDMLIMDTPVSIQVVPKAVMNDQKATTIKDALENVSSVRPQSSLGLSNAFITRGFRNGRVFRNGLVANGLGIGEGAQFDSANLERVEVLKGPAAVLFGRIEPGGLVNLVTKKPRTDPYYSVEQRFGSYDLYRTEWDATNALTEDKSLSYRFTGAYQNNVSAQLSA